MYEFKQKLEETLNRLYKQNKLSIDAYSELMEFADPNQNLQLQQTGVSGRSEQLVCGCGSNDIYIEPKVYNCQDCGKSWK